ncbi:MAG TPA: glycosyltransferase family A protein, partial [Bacteroidales bacterium]|nr:glycosyltransferase family A protein [Bacteroidales bacterium]
MKLEFIIPTYKRINNLCTLLYSLKSQTSNDWTAQVISDNTPEEIIRPVINHFSEDSRINFNVLSKRYNDWGHTPRNVGLNHSKEELLVMTGEDNY